jgi:hypothetical protein
MHRRQNVCPHGTHVTDAHDETGHMPEECTWVLENLHARETAESALRCVLGSDQLGNRRLEVMLTRGNGLCTRI